MAKKDQENRHEEFKDQIQEEISKKLKEERSELEKVDKNLQDNIKSLQTDISTLSKGMLSVQGKQFRQDCRRLLANDHYITVEEYEELEMDYTIYKELKGNHTGDALHQAVVEKFQAQMLAK